MESDKDEVPQQIGLELPDYEELYLKWKEKQEKKEESDETVIVIDIY